MKRLAIALVAAAAVLAAALPTLVTTTTNHAAANPDFAAAGFRAYVDSLTGEFYVPDPEPELPLSEDLLNSLRTDTDSLVEVASPLPDGGTMVRLNGRFSSIYVGHTAANGRADAECLSQPEVRDGVVHLQERGGERR